MDRLLPGVPVDDLRPMTQLVDDWLREPRFYTGLLSAFGSLALVLAAGGVAAVVGSGVAQRTREIGIRMALGARSRQILASVTGEVLAFAGLGVLLGTAVAAAGGRVLEGLLFETGPRDPWAFGGALAGLAAAALLGAWAAARKALAVEPAHALRHE